MPGRKQFSIGLIEGPSLGFDVAVNVEELDDVDHPRAKAGGGCGLGLDELRVELLVLLVGLQGGDDVRVNVLLVVVNQTFQKWINLFRSKILIRLT